MGEKLFVDYAGQTMPVVNRDTGELREAQIFAVLWASSYTYAEATWMQSLPDWSASHVRAFEFTIVRSSSTITSMGVAKPCASPKRL